MSENSHFAPIPEVFWSFETGKPIAHCSLCNKDLMIPGTQYLIEKAFKDGEVIFEYAICTHCHSDVVSEFSEESMTALQNYFEKSVDFEQRAIEYLKQNGPRTDKWISHCMVKGYPQAECGEYQIYGCFMDTEILFNGFPYILCGEVMEEIMDLLSDATIGAMGDLTDRLFGIDAPKDILIF